MSHATDADHQHAPEHSHAHTLAASGEATVVLDIGGEIGALVLHTPHELAGREIDIFRAGEQGPAMHSAVRARELPGGSVHAAVYPVVPEGDYVIPAVGTLPSLPVTIRGGEVTEVTWR
ncbi:MAG: hypothetical protein QOE62_134 [Actinomycetota bacterium]|jgi:hypothetical protein|nr:hypothetical protein [Actinomycetota bacterium]